MLALTMRAICQCIRASTIHLLLLILLNLLEVLENILQSLKLGIFRVAGINVLCLELLVFLQKY